MFNQYQGTRSPVWHRITPGTLHHTWWGVARGYSNGAVGMTVVDSNMPLRSLPMVTKRILGEPALTRRHYVYLVLLLTVAVVPFASFALDALGYIPYTPELATFMMVWVFTAPIIFFPSMMRLAVALTSRDRSATVLVPTQEVWNAIRVLDLYGSRNADAARIAHRLIFKIAQVLMRPEYRRSNPDSKLFLFAICRKIVDVTKWNAKAANALEKDLEMALCRPGYTVADESLDDDLLMWAREAQVNLGPSATIVSITHAPSFGKTAA